jgi:hypothetical protein
MTRIKREVSVVGWIWKKSEFRTMMIKLGV